MITEIQTQITKLCNILGNEKLLKGITANKAFPIMPESKFQRQQDTDIDNLVLATESIHEAIDHLMKARNLLLRIGLSPGKAEPVQRIADLSPDEKMNPFPPLPEEYDPTPEQRTETHWPDRPPFPGEERV